MSYNQPPPVPTRWWITFTDEQRALIKNADSLGAAVAWLYLCLRGEETNRKQISEMIWVCRESIDAQAEELSMVVTGDKVTVEVNRRPAMTLPSVPFGKLFIVNFASGQLMCANEVVWQRG